MINNDVLRSVRYMLDLSDAQVVELAREADYEIAQADVHAFLMRDDEEGFLECGDEALARILDGLIFSRRGRDKRFAVPPVELPLSNNMVLKKLRVAFELQDDDMHAILQSAGFFVSKPELSALFRKAGHKNYRACGDQWLRNFLKGLTLHIRG